MRPSENYLKIYYTVSFEDKIENELYIISQKEDPSVRFKVMDMVEPLVVRDRMMASISKFFMNWDLFYDMHRGIDDTT